MEVQPPGCDRLFIVPRLEKSRDRISFTSLGNLAPDLGHSSAINSLVIESPDICIAVQLT